VEVRGLTVGPRAENCWIVRGSEAALVVDPGDEAPRILAALDGTPVEAILLTHCHFDHIGAVAPLARATGAPVWCPELEVPVLADVMRYVPWPGIGPYESYAADHTLAGGETLTLAGIELEVLFTPGHSPGHLTYAADGLLLSGDVLFAGSVGRTDLPGGDHATLLDSIALLLARFEDGTRVLPGHMEETTLGRERTTNPFLQALPSR
jgi:hydroxyacylglutathione hydrolase